MTHKRSPPTLSVSFHQPHFRHVHHRVWPRRTSSAHRVTCWRYAASPPMWHHSGVWFCFVFLPLVFQFIKDCLHENAFITYPNKLVRKSLSIYIFKEPFSEKRQQQCGCKNRCFHQRWNISSEVKGNIYRHHREYVFWLWFLVFWVRRQIPQQSHGFQCTLPQDTESFPVII